MDKVNVNDFAAKFAECGNAYEAALFAGAGRLTAAFEGIRLISNRSVRKKISAIRAQSAEVPAAAGLRRIAFGRNNDAVRLVCSEQITDEDIDSADLYGVSEIKCSKGGVTEIKFFDRLKALEALGEYEKQRDSAFNAQSLISAIYGADAFGGGEGENEP